MPKVLIRACLERGVYNKPSKRESERHTDWLRWISNYCFCHMMM